MTTTSIATTLGAGSGIDIKSLVTSLVDNQFAVKTAQLKTKGDALTAQVSGVGTLKSAITGFSTALNSLVRGGTLATAPTSSNTNVLKISTLPGASPPSLSASVEVRALAKPQSSGSAIIADRTAAIGTGSFTLTFGNATVSGGAMTGFTAGGGTPVSIAIDSSNSSLDGIAAAINAAGAGVTASILSDSNGARLSLKSATGASQAFTLQSTDAGLSDLNVGVGGSSTIGSAAQDAVVAIDGIAISRSSNSISNLIDGVKLDLVAEGTVSLGTATATAALTQAVSDFVSTYNELLSVIQEQTNIVTGPLRNDPAAKTMQRALAQLPLTRLIPSSTSGMPATLAEIGVGTNRNGTLTLDTARLSKAISTYPAAVEKMFAEGTGATENGIAAALGSISNQATDKTYGLGASEARYTKAQSVLTDDQQKAVDAAEAMRTRLTKQFSGMDARVAAYKATQSFLKNQVDAWNSSN